MPDWLGHGAQWCWIVGIGVAIPLALDQGHLLVGVVVGPVGAVGPVVAMPGVLG